MRATSQRVKPHTGSSLPLGSTRMGASVAGLTIWPTPATPAGTALAADATQIVVAVREDASVAVSDQFAFHGTGPWCV